MFQPDFQGARNAINGETEVKAPQPTCHCVASANPNMVLVLPGSLVSQQDQKLVFRIFGSGFLV